MLDSKPQNFDHRRAVPISRLFSGDMGKGKMPSSYSKPQPINAEVCGGAGLVVIRVGELSLIPTRGNT